VLSTTFAREALGLAVEGLVLAILLEQGHHIKRARIYGSDTSPIIAAVLVERTFDRRLLVL
jgi:hypothetical protein